MNSLQQEINIGDEREVLSSQQLISPDGLKAQLELSSDLSEQVARHRKAINDIVEGRDSRLLVVLGPCSLHCAEATIDYAERLLALQERCEDKVLLVMRAYLEKPRTTVGWKGMLYDPMLDGEDDMVLGLEASRKLLLDIVRVGLPIATEALNPLAFQYLDDVVSWVAIGARTTESQTHREMASAMQCAVGFKNSTDGSLEAAINALISASRPHSFYGTDGAGRLSIIRSQGNSHGQLVLRGGKHGSNYDALHIAKAKKALSEVDLLPSIVIDCSHENSGKDHAQQARVVGDVMQQIKDGCTSIRGLMLESHLKAGRQNISANLEYGQSITDACIDWEETEYLVMEMHGSLG
jgi:3-deoxy-7-phosphoheptulonate synthase